MRHFIVSAIAFVVSVGLAYPGYAAPHDVGYESATIYLYSWTSRNRSRLTIQDVRDVAKVTISISDGNVTNRFVASLHLDLMLDNEGAGEEDPKLVIDLMQNDGSVETLYAGSWHLFSADGKSYMTIDDEFKRRFSFESAD